jgi:transposase
MPWHEESPMSLRQQFVQDVQRQTVSITELCTAYGISCKTAYKWLARYEAGGLPALADQSRRPQTSPTAVPPELIQRLLTTRRRHPSWGPRKLLRLVRRHHPDAPWPARPTLARYLKQAGLVVPPRRVRRPGHAGPPQAPMDAPNAVWTTDFKGQFRLGDGTLCYPLTLADGYSRFVLDCRALTSVEEHPNSRTPLTVPPRAAPSVLTPRDGVTYGEVAGGPCDHCT